MGPEEHELGAVSMPVVERYLLARLGGSVRGAHGLPPIRAPFELAELRPGYRIGKMVFAGRERSSPLDRSGQALATTSVHDLVELSHYLDASVDVIRQSLLDPDDKPLFSVRPE